MRDNGTLGKKAIGALLLAVLLLLQPAGGLPVRAQGLQGTQADMSAQDTAEI